MKRKKLFLLMIAFLLIGTSRVVGQDKSDAAPVNLKGIWQMCFYVSGTPQVPGELKPSNSFKILSDDGNFTNMTMIPNHGAIIIGSGTYRQTAPNAYTCLLYTSIDHIGCHFSVTGHSSGKPTICPRVCLGDPYSFFLVLGDRK